LDFSDETQLGGLSSLLSSPPATPTSPTVPKPPKKRYLEESVGMGGATPLAAWEGTSFDKVDDNSRDSSPDSEGKDSGLCAMSPLVPPLVSSSATSSAVNNPRTVQLCEAWSQLGRPGPSASVKTANLIDRVVDLVCAAPAAPAAPTSWASAAPETNNNEASYMNGTQVFIYLEIENVIF